MNTDVANTWNQGSRDDKNTIYRVDFEPETTIGQTVRWYYTRTLQTIEADVRLNTNVNWTTACHPTPPYDVQSVALHELGHVLGLADATSHTEAVMWGDENGCQRSLAQDDIDGLEAIYPHSPPCTGCDCAQNGFNMLQDVPPATAEDLAKYEPGDFTPTEKEATKIEAELRTLLENNQSVAADVNSFITAHNDFLSSQDASTPPVIGTEEIEDASELIENLASATSSSVLRDYLYRVERRVRETNGMTLDEALGHLASSLSQRNNPSPQEEGETNLLRDESSQEEAIFAYPTPAREAATVQYLLEQSTTVHLAVFDVTGRRVATLANERQAAGTHRERLDVSHLASGVYFVRLKTGAQTRVVEIVVQK